MRLDKFITYVLDVSRVDAKKIIKNKEISVNGITINDVGFIIDEDKDIVKRGEVILKYSKYIYLMLNKPAGVISATIDRNKTVLDLIDKYKKYNLSIAGRLDIDSVGLLILTNDGELIHNLTSPKHNVYKKYYVEVIGEFKSEDIEKFKEGLIIPDGKGDMFKTLPAKLEIISNNSAYISIMEGKFHQIKYMCEAIGLKVIYLKRLEIGALTLDENLKEGEYRHLDSSEIDLLKSFTKTRQ
jgi:16S rRNA pseudouridine516 synthase